MKTKEKIRNALIFTIVFTVCLASLLYILQGRRAQTAATDLTIAQETQDGWVTLFDGETLTGWEIVDYGEVKPYVKDSVLVLPKAVRGLMTCIRWIGEPLPTNNYTVYYEARRTEGNDIFAGLTFPYKNTFATLIFGGWSDSVCGISSIDGYNASENETYTCYSHVNNQWYTVQMYVTTDSIRASIDSVPFVDLKTTGKKLDVRSLLPTGFTLCTYNSAGEIRNLRIKKLKTEN